VDAVAGCGRRAWLTVGERVDLAEERGGLSLVIPCLAA
jgi:hypothetical protein